MICYLLGHNSRSLGSCLGRLGRSWCRYLTLAFAALLGCRSLLLQAQGLGEVASRLLRMTQRAFKISINSNDY